MHVKLCLQFSIIKYKQGFPLSEYYITNEFSTRMLSYQCSGQRVISVIEYLLDHTLCLLSMSF